MAAQAPAWGLRPVWLLIVLISIPVTGALFWWLGQQFLGSQLRFLEYQQFFAVIAIAVAGGYQIYFWVQRNHSNRPAICLKIALDDWIPFRAEWIWLYSFLYYVMIGVAVMSIKDLADGIHLLYGGMLLLFIGCAIFYFFPTYVPYSYRHFDVNSHSTRYLAFVQSMDNERNAFPSMHCALAVYIGLVVMDLPGVGPWIGGAYIAVISVSCLLVKQHVIADTFAGVALGAVVYYLNESLPGWLSAA